MLSREIIARYCTKNRANYIKCIREMFGRKTMNALDIVRCLEEITHLCNESSHLA